MLAPPRGALFSYSISLISIFHDTIFMLYRIRPSLPISFPFPLEVCFHLSFFRAGQSCYCWAILLLLGNLVIAGQSCCCWAILWGGGLTKLPQLQSFHNFKASTIPELPQLQSFVSSNSRWRHLPRDQFPFWCWKKNAERGIRTADLPRRSPTVYLQTTAPPLNK